MKNILIILLGGALAAALLVFVDAPREVDQPTSGDRGEEESDTQPTNTSRLRLVPQEVSFSDGTGATFQVAEPFRVAVAAENLGKARSMAVSPDGRLFVPDMVDYELSHEGVVSILDDFNQISRRFESRTTYLSNVRGPHDVAFYTDEDGNDWLYLTLTEHLVRYPYEEGDTEPSGDPEIVVTFPNEQNESADGGVWHLTRTMLFHDGTLYVSIGSGCNACEETYEEDGRPAILAMTPEGEDVRLYAEGIKNAVGLEWANGHLYATENGVDHLGNNAPNDVMYRVREGEHYGWPYCYELDGEKRPDDIHEWENPVSCSRAASSFATFDAHSAPLGVTYFENAHRVLEDTFLVAQQGSWDASIGTGYQLVRVTHDGEKEVFMRGFMNEEGERVGRPVDILQRDDDSFFVTDDWGGRLYYLSAVE